MSHTRAELGSRFSTAFVTGASGGLGRAFCECLLSEGVDVWGTARAPERLGIWPGPGRFTAVKLDLNDRRGSEAAFAAASQAAGGAFDLVIHNAGYGLFGAFEQVAVDQWEAQLQAMVVTTMRLNHAALNQFRSRTPAGGTLVNVSSLAVEFPLPYLSGYNVAKAALSALSESLIFETRGSGVTVIDFRPGDYRTSFNQAMSTLAASPDPLLQPYWRTLEANLDAAPAPARAAQDLRRALLRGHSGTVRSGSFFQASLAPLLASLVPASWRRRVQRWYFGGR
ncbi:MAG: SDR family NAD(P)-dependent oxidoreductase [Opitutaceae bacterium]|nr:SDR family NAD(P)-dependent oxidoreductase [Opitutaceae bacterium]